MAPFLFFPLKVNVLFHKQAELISVKLAHLHYKSLWKTLTVWVQSCLLSLREQTDKHFALWLTLHFYVTSVWVFSSDKRAKTPIFNCGSQPSQKAICCIYCKVSVVVICINRLAKLLTGVSFICLSFQDKFGSYNWCQRGSFSALFSVLWWAGLRCTPNSMVDRPGDWPYMDMDEAKGGGLVVQGSHKADL